MTIQTFIEKAIEGGWKPSASWFGDVPVDSDGYHTVLLNPLAWKAVGKVEGWVWNDEKRNAGYIYNMHRMIDALAEGKTIEQFLEIL